MLRTRVIPSLLLKDGSLVKTVNFKKYNYIGDPINTVKIFNELEVDELMFLDITASKDNRAIDYQMLIDIANECFMPLSYGGNIKCIKDAKKIFNIGFEKVIINSNSFNRQELIKELSDYFGSQSIIGSIDIKKSFFGKYNIYTHNGTKKQKCNYIDRVKELVNFGVGEILVTSIDNDGTWNGYDIELIEEISKSVSVPVIASGGAGSLNDIKNVVENTKVSAVALGSMIVYQSQNMGVLINFPDKDKLKNIGI